MKFSRIAFASLLFASSALGEIDCTESCGEDKFWVSQDLFHCKQKCVSSTSVGASKLLGWKCGSCADTYLVSVVEAESFLSLYY
jgi:hypothetical protein